MVVGLGVDIVEIERMRAALQRRPRMKQRLFSEEEQWYCEHKARPEIHYALRFAAKEAVLKALGTGFRGMKFLDVEVARDEKGKPYPRLYGAAAEYAQQMGIVEMHLSLSYTQTTAVASAVALTNQARPAPKPQPSAREELAREFKELRALLDEGDGVGSDIDKGNSGKAPEEADSDIGNSSVRSAEPSEDKDSL
ncbi:MAG: holo-ACP synthase [Coriobacteriia bacterium]|nr:holo-ACP synthase [Coriobacteriia bacterium]